MSTLIRLTPCPDELDKSYLGRLMRINGYLAEKEVMGEMQRLFGLQQLPLRERSSMEPLSMMAGQTLQQFALHHSTIPFRRAITSYCPDVPHGSTTRRTLLWNSGMVAARPGAYLCPTCVSNDVLLQGVSYWRRSHQMPGEFWCTEHSTPLQFLEAEENFLRPPSHCLDQVRAVPLELATDAWNCNSVIRFLGVSKGLVSRGEPLDVKYVALALRRRAADLGIQTHGGKVKGPLLSDRIRSAFPTEWLRTVFPSLTTKVDGQILNHIDGVLFMRTSASSVSAYILAASVMYDSAESALDDLVQARESFEGAPKRRSRSQPNVDSAALVAAFVVGKGHPATIAKQLSIPLHQVLSVMAKMGLPNLKPRGTGAGDPWRAAVAFFVEKKSLSASAAESGLSLLEMEDVLRPSGANLVSALLSAQPLRTHAGRTSKCAVIASPRTVIHESTSGFSEPLVEQEAQYA